MPANNYQGNNKSGLSAINSGTNGATASTAVQSGLNNETSKSTKISSKAQNSTSNKITTPEGTKQQDTSSRGVTATSFISAYRNGINNSYDDNNRATLATTDQNQIITNIFRNTKEFRDVSKYRLMRGVPDFGNLVQFNPYETGYGIFIICQMPRFIEKLARQNDYYRKLMINWMHIIEYEFKSFDGLEALSADTIQLGDDLNNINVISKVNMQSASEFSLTYEEKSGSPLTKFARLYMTGIKDPRTQVKNYHGLIHSNQMDPGFENEVFTFMFIATDNTMREVEAAYLLLACQLNSADTDMYNYTKGDIAKRDVTVKFSGYPVQSAFVDLAARDLLAYLIGADAQARQIIINSNNFRYAGLEKVTRTLQNYGNINIDHSGSVTNQHYSSLDDNYQPATYRTADFYPGSTNSGADLEGAALSTEDFNY